MPVEVIDAKPQPEVAKETVCRHCAVKLRYVPVDIEEKSTLITAAQQKRIM